MKEMLKKRKQIPSKEYPSTTFSMNNVANMFENQGQLDEAPAMKQALGKRKQTSSEEHPSIVSAMNNLANTLGHQGQLNEAVVMKKEVLEKRKRTLGEEHPSTISAINNLANTLEDQGQLSEAAAMKKEVLAKMRRTFGEEHPSTVSAMNNLANTLGHQGQLNEAVVMKKEVLEKWKRILGEEHPSTISAMNSLANTLENQGQLYEAAAIKEVLAKMRQTLGEHPSTTSAMSNIANTLEHQGQVDGAAATAAACANEVLSVNPAKTDMASSQPRGGEKLSLNEEQKRMLVDSLRFEQIDSRQMTIKSAHAKTCKWLLKNSEYVDWLDATKLSEHHGFLWIKGKPGTGKSTLMKFALAVARKTMKDIIISFFFNARGEELEKSTIGAYRSLLLQLVERLPALQCLFDSLGLSTSSISTSHQWSAELLKTLLEQAIQSLGESSVVCFIDALDECNEHQIRDMISFFEHISELAVSAGIRFQVCLSSRHYPHITIRKNLGLVLEGQEGHNQDINNYLDSELKIGHSKVAQQIRTELQEKASGIFVWVVLVVGILNKEYDGGRMHALRRRLREIPSDLHELFRDILTRDSHNRDELVLCIQWVLFARQPLSPEQLYFAILSGVEPGLLSRWDPDEITGGDISRFILNSSKGLAEITKSKNQKVQFIHESTKDFLLKEDGLADIWPNLGSNLQGHSHERLKQCCLNYISIDVFTPLEIPESLPKASSQNAVHLRQSATSAFPFLEYAVRNVLYHADVAAGSGITQENLIHSFPLDRWIRLDNLFEKHEVRRHTEYVSLLYVLAEGNMSNLVRAHPSILSCLELENERYGLPFFAALATGSEEAIQAFVEAFAANHSSEGWFHKLCSQYCQAGGRGSKLGRDFKFSNRKTVLSHLAELGNEAIFALVLQTGKTMPDSKDEDGRTPLSHAALKGQEAIVKLLLDTGKVGVDSKDFKYRRTPLSWAAEKGHAAVVKLLLETGKVDVDSKDFRYGGTPLSWASQNGHDAVVKLLLETGNVDFDSKDEDGRTPLWWAARNGSEAVVKLLLETGKVDVDSKSNSGRTPLSWAAGSGYEAVVKLLLETGKVDVDSKDSQYGRTPLLWAAENGHEAVVKLLLETGKVDVDSKDNKCKQTPLSWAAENGHEAVVKLLLATGQVDVGSKDRDGRTPLSWAADNGNKAIVKLLRPHSTLS